MFQKVMMPIHGIMVPGMCPPWRPKGLQCPRVDETSAPMSTRNRNPDGIDIGKEIPACEGVYPTDPDIRTQWTSQEVGSTAETNTQGVELAVIPNNSIEVYKKGKTTITVTIDPLIKKDIRLKWTYELGDVETPAADINSAYDASDDAGIGFTDGAGDANLLTVS